MCGFIRFLSFAIAGAFFGAAGLFITANAGSGDPLIGAPFLLKVFTAVVLGGTLIGGGRGGAVGTVFGALTLTIVVDIFLVMGVRTYYVPIVEGAILLIAVLALGTHAELPSLAEYEKLLEPSRSDAARLWADRRAARCGRRREWAVRGLACQERAYIAVRVAGLCHSDRGARHHCRGQRRQFQIRHLSRLAPYVR